MCRGRRPDRDEHAATDRLDPSGDDQLVHGLRGACQRGSHGERGQRAHEQAAGPPQVGQPAGQRDRQDEDQQVAVDDPAGLSQLHPGRSRSRIGEVGQDGRQRHRGDHELETGEEDTRSEDGEEHERRAAVHLPECRARCL
jgi:hypothetical protein